MPLVDAKCTNCGAPLKVDNTKDAAICRYCGSAFIVEKAINKYNITNNNTIHADVVNIFKTNSPNMPHKSDNELINDDIQKITEAGYNRLLSPSSLIQMIDHITNNPQNIHKSLLYQRIQNYCTNLDFKFDFSHTNIFLPKYDDFKHVWNDPGNKGNDGYHFIAWLEFETDKLTGKYEILQKVQEKITTYYIKLLKTGYTSANWSESFGPRLWGVKANNQGEFVNIENKVNNKFLVPYFLEGLENAKNVNSHSLPSGEYTFCLGQYSIVKNYPGYGAYSEQYHSEYLKEIEDKKRESRRNNGVCQYCGSKFNGLLMKKCSKCGKPKDY